MREEEELELAVYRALRGEVPPSVRLIVVAAAASDRIRLNVFFEGPQSQPWMQGFEEGVESELQLSSRADATSNTLLSCTYLPSASLERTPGMLVVYDNPWAEWTADR